MASGNVSADEPLKLQSSAINRAGSMGAIGSKKNQSVEMVSK
jgi:hypothetical protein